MKGFCRCGAVWMGLRKTHCANCHNTFSGIGAFDRHMTMRGCKPPETVGLMKVANIWRQPGSWKGSK